MNIAKRIGKFVTGSINLLLNLVVVWPTLAVMTILRGLDRGVQHVKGAFRGAKEIRGKGALEILRHPTHVVDAELVDHDQEPVPAKSKGRGGWLSKVAITALLVYAAFPAVGALTFHTAYNGGGVRQEMKTLLPEWAGGFSRTEEAVYKVSKGADYHVRQAIEHTKAGKPAEALSDAARAYAGVEKPNPAERAAGFLKFW